VRGVYPSVFEVWCTCSCTCAPHSQKTGPELNTHIYAHTHTNKQKSIHTNKMATTSQSFTVPAFDSGSGDISDDFAIALALQEEENALAHTPHHPQTSLELGFDYSFHRDQGILFYVCRFLNKILLLIVFGNTCTYTYTHTSINIFVVVF